MAKVSANLNNLRSIIVQSQFFRDCFYVSAIDLPDDNRFKDPSLIHPSRAQGPPTHFVYNNLHLTSAPLPSDVQSFLLVASPKHAPNPSEGVIVCINGIDPTNNINHGTCCHFQGLNVIKLNQIIDVQDARTINLCVLVVNSLSNDLEWFYLPSIDLPGGFIIPPTETAPFEVVPSIQKKVVKGKTINIITYTFNYELPTSGAGETCILMPFKIRVESINEEPDVEIHVVSNKSDGTKTRVRGSATGMPTTKMWAKKKKK